MDSQNVFFRLRLKNSLFILLIVGVILACLISVLNAFMSFSGKYEVQRFMRSVVQEDGAKLIGMYADSREDGTEKLPEDKPKEELPDHHPGFLSFMWADGDSSASWGFHDCFTAEVDPQKNIVSVIRNFISERESGLIEEIASYSAKTGRPSGNVHGMTYLYSSIGGHDMLVLVDTMNDIANKNRFRFFSIVIYLFSLLVLFLIAWLISHIVVKDVEGSFNRQRQFISDASHELKTPIAVISANISVLEQQVKENRWLNYIKMENERMGQLVKDMLYLAREDAGVMEYDMKELDLCDVTACAVLPFESLAYEQGKKLSLKIPDEPLNIVGDEKKLKQAIIILTDNAMKNSDSGADVRVSVGMSGQKAFVKVYNTGPGVPVEDRKRIFNRFYRSDSSRTRDTGGCGLGLSIAQTIAEGHGGKIALESETGSFAEFTIFIACVQNKKKHRDAPNEES